MPGLPYAAGIADCLAVNGGYSAMVQEWPSLTQTISCCASIILAATQQCQQQPGDPATVMALGPTAIRGLAGWSVGPTRGCRNSITT